MIFFSFTDYNGYSNTYEFVGLENYIDFFDSDNLEVFKVSKYYFLSAIIQFVIGTFLAFFVFFHKKYQKILIIIITVPLFMNSVAVVLMFIMFFRPLGVFDSLLQLLHLASYESEADTIKWLGDANIVNYTLAVISAWRYTPFTFILMYSGINTVNKDIIKSAVLQGASKFDIARYIIMPNIKLTINITLIMLIIGVITAIEIPSIITNGAMDTKTILMRIHEVAFNMRNYGLASVLTIIVVVIIVSITLLLNKVGDSNEKN